MFNQPNKEIRKQNFQKICKNEKDLNSIVVEFSEKTHLGISSSTATASWGESGKTGGKLKYWKRVGSPLYIEAHRWQAQSIEAQPKTK